MYTLIAYATHWGSKYGGINSFNEDFLRGFSVAYGLGAQTVCIVARATKEEVNAAGNVNVRLVPLPYGPQATALDSTHAQASIYELKNAGISYDADKTVWLGHDRITGAAAIEAARIGGGRSAVIHHMSYAHYESYAEDSQSAAGKAEKQAALFRTADLVLAVGPLLRDAAADLVAGSKPVHMLIPGLADIDTQDAPKTFVAFLSGRLSDDAARVKQGQLGVAAFATAHREARDNGMPDALVNQPRLLLRGVDFEGRVAHSDPEDMHDPETELKQFAETYARAVINLHALPFTHDRRQLYSELSKSSVALMPSWHEGFGLVAWEAIAAGVPLIVSKNSGVYKLLEEEYPGMGTGCVYPVEVRASLSPPFFNGDDLRETVAKLRQIANNPGRARQQAGQLRNLLLEKHTWAACAEQAAQAFGWALQKGSVADPALTIPRQAREVASLAPAPPSGEVGPLQLPTGQWRAGIGMADSQLLRAEEALLPFDVARQPDVDTLDAWLDDGRWPQSVRLITGAGGQGKTRLALEICQRRRASGWHAGFLDSNLEVNAMSAAWQSLRALDRPLLVVVDYAETRQSAFLALLRASIQNPGAKPLRMLLLARDAGEWWDNLPSKDTTCEALLSGYATTGPFRLPPLYAAESDRREAYGKSLSAFARALGATPPTIIPDLVGEHFERPLYVQMAALLTLYGEQPTTAQGLTKALLNHERRYWRGLLGQYNWPEPERRAEQLLALTTLAGGFVTPRAAEPYWASAKGEVLPPADFNSLFRALATLYPGAQGLQALRPDLLGEALVAQALLRPGGETLLDAALTNTASQPVRRNALTVLARLSSHRPDLTETLVEVISRHLRHCYLEAVAVSRETVGRLPDLVELAFAQMPPGDKSQVAGLLSNELREESVQLANLSCLVFEYLVEKTKEKFQRKPGKSEPMAEYAQALLGYALSLGRVGHYDQACEIDLRALELYRRLRVKAPSTFEPHYAVTLGNYAVHLSEAGKYEEALEFNRQALDIKKQLAQKNSDHLKSDYATSLSNHANYLKEVGQYEEALLYAHEALEIHHGLALKNPEQFEANYAMSLSNYAIHLTGVGQHKEALEHGQHAVEILERLTTKNVDRFEPGYATSLNNYARHLSDSGEYEEALGYCRQALGVRQRLAQKNPVRFEDDYAVSLSGYAQYLSEVGEYEEAILHARRAVEIRTRLVGKNPRRFAGGLLSNTCFIHFLSWLCDKDGVEVSFDSGQMMASVPLTERPLMQLYLAFVDACQATDEAARSGAFRDVLIIWGDLPLVGKNRAEPYWLCAAAWCERYGCGEPAEMDWRERWRRFSEQRKGRVPRWMTDVAGRLGFELPG